MPGLSHHVARRAITQTNRICSSTLHMNTQCLGNKSIWHPFRISELLCIWQRWSWQCYRFKFCREWRFRSLSIKIDGWESHVCMYMYNNLESMYTNQQWLLDWLTDWLDEWMNDWMIDRMIAYLIGWMIDWMNESLTDRLIDWLIAWMNDDRLTDWLLDWLSAWANESLIESSTDWLSHRLIDWLIDRLSDLI